MANWGWKFWQVPSTATRIGNPTIKFWRSDSPCWSRWNQARQPELNLNALLVLPPSPAAARRRSPGHRVDPHGTRTILMALFQVASENRSMVVRSPAPVSRIPVSGVWTFFGGDGLRQQCLCAGCVQRPKKRARRAPSDLRRWKCDFAGCWFASQFGSQCSSDYVGHASVFCKPSTPSGYAAKAIPRSWSRKAPPNTKASQGLKA